MIGLFYMGWVMVSHIGAKIREFDHYINRHVDNKTNTYVDIYGNRRDNDTNQLRTMVIENNGDVVLLDKKHRVARNVSLDERMQKWKERRNDPTRDPIMETSLKTKELRTTYPKSPISGEPMYVKGRVYLDYETGASYYQVLVTVDKEYCHRKRDISKYFYVNTNNPFDLVRISDYQKEIEENDKNNNRFNWLDNIQEETAFIKEYNNRPYSAIDIDIKTKQWVIKPL